MEQYKNILEILVVILPILIAVAYVTVFERKAMASLQRRVGPNTVGVWGTGQAFSDALKLIVKENIIPIQSDKFLFYLGPILNLFFALIGWLIIPFNNGIVLGDLSLGILYTLAISALGGYGILLAGWAANSKYAFMGALRSSAQIISYELILSTSILLVIILSGTFNYTIISILQISIYYIIPLFPIFILFLISSLAETNRAPMDLAEAESELTAGFFTEHSSTIFVFFFLSEYANILLICTIGSILFLGSYNFVNLSSILNILINNLHLNSYFIFILNTIFNSLILGIKSSILVFIFIWIRASFPRVRYDQLMETCWIIILPIAFAFVFIIPSIILLFDSLPLS